jgi:serine/threonine-protein kinase
MWAFGCVLYEMLTGRAAFARATITDTLAAVVDREPQWSALPPGTSAATRRLLERCLEKDPRRRYRDVGDIRRDLEDLAAVPLVPSPKRKSLRIRMPAVLACAAALGLGAVAGLYLWQRASTEPSPPGAPVARFTTIAGGYSNLARPIMAWFPDGSGFVYVARDDTGSRLFVRTLNELQSRALAGSESGANPFLSPDGAWIGFFADRKLKKLPVRGGAAIDLSPITSVPLGASWTGTGSIVMGSIDGSGLWQVPLSGGPPQPVVRAPGSDTSGAEAWPQALPDGGSVLFTMMPTAQRPAFVAIASLASGERKPLLEGSAAQYIPTGHMVYARGTSLMGVRFDLGRLEVVGEPVVLLDGVLQADRAGAAQFNVATTGSLLYIDRADASPRRQLMLVDRHGQAEPISPEWRGYRNPRVSPDGQRIVADIEEVRGSDVWIYDRLRAAWNQLTFNGRSLAPIWTPDGKRVTYATAEENSKLLWKLADGSGSEELLSSEAGNPHSWSPDGRWLARTSGGVGLSAALAVLSMDAERRTRPFLSKEGSSFNAPAFSPDGRWLAYVSDESGRREIYVRGFPAGGQWRVSSDGGTQPMWARNGSELFYRNGDKMMAVDVATTPVFAAGTPKLLFEGRYESPAVRSNYDVTSDRRFVMVKADDQHPRTAYLTVVLNWAEELKRRIPVHR